VTYDASSCGGARATDVYGTVFFYGGAGYYGFSCACDSSKLWVTDKEGSMIWEHVRRCPLQHNAS